MRLCEFNTSLRNGSCGTELFAWARYERGDVPEPVEFSYIDGRVKAKFPNAELVEMRRRFVPASPAEPTEVWWEFKWIVFKSKEGGKQVKDIDLSAVGAVCDECSRLLGFKPKNKVVGVWMDNCEVCPQRKACTNLWHGGNPPNWNPPKGGGNK